MAQRTIHYLFGELFSRELSLRDKNRFLLGSVLPDAFASDGDRDITHFASLAPDGRRCYDFELFRRRFGGAMAEDDLYLGYYMHLVEDDCYRQFVYSRPELSRRVRGPEGFTVLHRDYHLLNAYIVGRWGLRCELRKPAGLEEEPVFHLTPMRIDGFLRDLAGDFCEPERGGMRILTEAVLDEFLDIYYPPCLAELRSAGSGASLLRAADFAWQPPALP